MTDPAPLSPEAVEALFTRSADGFVFARWERPIVPVVFGVEEKTLAVIKGACEAIVTLAGHKMAETDPDLGANLMVFFVRDWSDLIGVPDLDRLVEGLEGIVGRLVEADANQYRVFRFEENGAIRACIMFIRMDDALAEVSAEALALSQMVQMILLWSDLAFQGGSPLMQAPDGSLILRPDIGEVIRAAYDPVLPAASQDPSFALRLAARLGRTN